MLQHNFVFQAEHQHFYDFKPLVWFVHFRAVGDPIAIARAIKAALNVTSTPFPQTLPSNPTTPLPAEEIGDILGSKPDIGSDGVVTYRSAPQGDDPAGRDGHQSVSQCSNHDRLSAARRREQCGGGSGFRNDLHLKSTPSIWTMQNQGWDVGCLYNQETDEFPQLYFSHQFKTGDSIELARQIRKGLNHMNLKFS